jgi:hypothetical protein
MSTSKPSPPKSASIRDRVRLFEEFSSPPPMRRRLGGDVATSATPDRRCITKGASRKNNNGSTTILSSPQQQLQGRWPVKSPDIKARQGRDHQNETLLLRSPLSDVANITTRGLPLNKRELNYLTPYSTAGENEEVFGFRPSFPMRIWFASDNGSPRQSNTALRELVLDSPTTTRIRRRKHNEKRYRHWKRFWELTYACLAIIELFLCWNGTASGPLTQKNVAIEVYQTDLDGPLAFVEKPNLFSTRSTAAPSKSRYHKREKGSRQRERIPFVGKVDVIYWTRRLNQSIRKMTWRDIIDQLFVVAILIHSIMASWHMASSRKVQAEQQSVQSSRKVTTRTRRRMHKYETSSTNRHFIMRWTGNRIKWNRTITEISRLSFMAVMLRLLFVPFFASNPFTPNMPEAKDRMISLGDAAAAAVSSWLYTKAATQVRRKIKAYVIQFATLAITRPWEASSRVQRVFMAIRWAEYLGPLIGTSNKLRGHVTDYLKKVDQMQRSKRAQLMWEQLAYSIRGDLLPEREASQIQENLHDCPRLRKARLGIVKLQRRFRYRSALSRLRIARAKRRLSDIRIGERILSTDTDCIADDLRREIRRQTRRNRTLLLRPNSRFAVVWRRTTVTCVLIEIAQLLLAPRLSPHLRRVPVEELLKSILRPSRLACRETAWLQIWLFFVDSLSQGIAELVRWISFFDVFITFFTGELEHGTGLLVAKPFFTRWILPGVALQLIVNPTMKDISQLVRACGRFAQTVGPMRVIHVVIAVLPILSTLVDMAVNTAYTFVSKENRMPIGTVA